MHVNQYKNRVVSPRTDIPGWGADRDEAKRPAGLTKESMPPTDTGAHWDVPEHQHHRVTVFQSIERPGCTHVFGTSAPPRGLSGLIRRYAYGLGEGIKSRWILLMLADRVDVVEGVFEDLAHGTIPNPVAEMGLKAEWKYNRAATMKRVVVGAAIAGGLAWMFAKRRKARAEATTRTGAGLKDVIRATTQKRTAPRNAAASGRSTVASVDRKETTVYMTSDSPVVTRPSRPESPPGSMLPH